MTEPQPSAMRVLIAIQPRTKGDQNYIYTNLELDLRALIDPMELGEIIAIRVQSGL